MYNGLAEDLLLLRGLKLSTLSDLFVNMDEKKDFEWQITFAMYLSIFMLIYKNIFVLIITLTMIFFIPS